MVQRSKPLITVSTPACLLLAILFLLVPWQWVTAWIIASTIHEMCHYIALKISRCRVMQVSIGLMGTWMKTEFSHPWIEAICALAGPVGSLCLLFAARVFPRVAFCGLCQGLINLLPIYPVDGGRAIKGILECFLPAYSALKTVKVLENMILLFLLILFIWLNCQYKVGWLPAFVIAAFWLKTKNPCKERRLRVQWLH